MIDWKEGPPLWTEEDRLYLVKVSYGEGEGRYSLIRPRRKDAQPAWKVDGTWLITVARIDGITTHHVEVTPP